MPNIAAVTLGFSTRLRLTAEARLAGRKRSTGEPGARLVGSFPMIRRKFARVVVRFDSAVRAWVLPAASCASDCATSVRVTSPTLKRSRVCGGGLPPADKGRRRLFFERLFEHANVAALNFESCRITQVIHVARGGL